MDIVERLRRTRATMLGTDDEAHFADCHKAADEIKRLRHALLTMLGDTDESDYMSAAEKRATAYAALPPNV